MEPVEQRTRQTRMFPAAFIVFAMAAASMGLVPPIQPNDFDQSRVVPAAARIQNHDTPQPRRRAIVWPDDCDYLAQGKGKNDYHFERACAAAIDAVDWSVLAKSSDDSKCEYEFPADLRRDPDFTRPGNGYVNFHWLSQGRYLVEIRCFSGAYNLGNIYLLYDETLGVPHAKLLKFPIYKFTGDGSLTKERTYVVGGRVFNTQRKELVTLDKYRGIGDCGTFALYSFAGDEPVLKEFRAKLDCDGKFPYQPTKQDQPSPRGWTVYYPP